MRYSRSESLSDHSTSTMCCSKDPSCPVKPGGLSRILEWSWQGGAVDMTINAPGNIEPHEAVPEISKGKVHITQDSKQTCA